MSTKQGVVSQVIGPVVDVRFPEGVELPDILDALVIDAGDSKIILETQKHVGEHTVRAISMDATEAVSYTHLTLPTIYSV